MEPPPDDLDFLSAQAEAEAEEDEQPPDDFDLPAPAKQQHQTTLPFAQQLPAQYLPALNEAQRSAVTYAPAGGLQILAGPGSGKTKVLTARVAYLIQHYKLSPEEMVVVTFTNKAANEMKARLKLLVGSAVVERLMMGTFHSVCVRYLRKYGKLVSLSPSFTVADRDDCMAIIKRAIQSTEVNGKGLGSDSVARLKKGFKPNTAGDIISQCKSRNITYREYATQETGKEHIGDEHRERVRMYAEVFRKYDEELRAGNALDFDDLLLFGLNLVERHPHVVGKVKTVLIDEFQDTSVIQYNFVKCLAKASASLTIVGDPDQSIYGWRNAEVENLERMLRDFKPVTQIFLEENYRSTGAILGAALAVVKQDPKRIDKSLKATHTSGSSVVLHCAPNAHDEAAYIAAQIKHLIAHTGGQLDFGDCAILLRYGALSRNIEVALQKAGIPSRMSGGHKFFDRQEVKDILSYLQLVENPSYTAAFLRVVNVPTRSIGDKTAKAILLAAQRYKLSPFEIAVKLANRSQIVTGITEPQRKGLREFVTAVRDLRNSADLGTSVSDLIDELVRKVRYQVHLERTHGPDSKDRWENLEELKAYATVVADENPEGVPDAALMDDEDVEMDEVHVGGVGSEEDEIEEFEGADDSGFEEIIMPLSSQAANEVASPLRTFLAVSMLATDSETEESKNDANARKVTISTCHSAKGLEWPVVFIPACEEGIYPFYRSSEPEQVDEERRLLYVAITRAQAFCTLSYAHRRMAGSETKDTVLSHFLASVSERYKTLFVSKLQKISATTRSEVSKIIGRPPVAEAAVATAIAYHTATLPAEPPTYEYSYSAAPTGSQGSQGGGFSTGRYSGSSFQGAGQKWNNRPSGAGPAPVSSGAGFQSALSTYRTTPATTVPVAGPSSQASTSKRPANNQPQLSFGQGASRPAGSTAGNGLRRLASTERILSFSQPGALRSLGSTSSSDLSQPTESEPTNSTPATLSSLPPPPPMPEAYHVAPPPARYQPPRPPKPASTAFKAPRPLATADRIISFSRPEAVPLPTASTPSSHASTSSTHAIPLPTVSSSTPAGPLVMPETRASKIDDAVLLNPVARPSTAPDLLASFQSSETAALSQLRNLGPTKGKENGVVVDLTSEGVSSDGVEVVERVEDVIESGRPKRGAAKRAMEGFPKKPPRGKKARSSK